MLKRPKRLPWLSPSAVMLAATLVQREAVASEGKQPEAGEPEAGASELGPEETEAPQGSAAGEYELSARDLGEASNSTAQPVRKHGLEFSAGPIILPAWYFSPAMAAYSTALCKPGLASDTSRGIVKNEGCNWFIGGQYIYRASKILDISGVLEYRKMALPDAMWIQHDDWDSSCKNDKGGDTNCDLGKADYVEADFSHLLLGADFTARGTLLRQGDWSWQLGGGGGIGLVIFTGGRLHQTPIGRDSGTDRPGSRDDEDSCENLDDLGDFGKCTPQWWDDPEVDQDGNGELDDDELEDDTLEDQDGFAECTDSGCSVRDLKAFGTREQTFGAPVLALPKMFISTRIMFQETYGLNLSGGFNGGFFFAAGVQYFFGPQKK